MANDEAKCTNIHLWRVFCHNIVIVSIYPPVEASRFYRIKKDPYKEAKGRLDVTLTMQIIEMAKFRHIEFQ